MMTINVGGGSFIDMAVVDGRISIYAVTPDTQTIAYADRVWIENGVLHWTLGSANAEGA